MTKTYQHNSLQALKNCLDNQLHPDFSLSFKNSSLHCHNALLSPSSQLLASLITQQTNDYTITSDLDASDNILSSVLSTFYGHPLSLSKANIIDVLHLSWNLKAVDLYNFTKDCIVNKRDATFQLPINKILNNLLNDNFKDQSIVYQNKSIQIHKFLLASVSGWFKKKWSHNWQGHDFIENTSEFTDKLHVNQDCFETFFKSIYAGQLVLSTENVFDYSHLAFYFEFNDLTKFINEFIKQTPSDVEWIFPAIEKANTSLDLRFVALMSDKLACISDLSNRDGISVEPEVLKTFNFNSVNNQWILKCLTKSFLECNDQLWNCQEVSTCLNLIDLNRIKVVDLYYIIFPLLKVSELFQVCVEFSLRVFSTFSATVPIEWIKWFIEQTNQHDSTSALEDFSILLETIVVKSRVSSLILTQLKPFSLQLFALNCKSSHLVLWVLNLLVKSFKSKIVSTSDLGTVLNSICLDFTDSANVYQVIDYLINDESSSIVVNEFIVKKVFPKVVREREELKKRQEEQRNVQQELEKRQKELEKRLKRKQKRNSNASLQAISTPIQLNIEPKYARFSAETKGSSLTLSNNGTVVTSSGCGSDRDTFVTIEHSSSVKRMSFTLLKKDGGTLTGTIGTYLGFSDISSRDVKYGVSLQSSGCDKRINGSNKDRLGPYLQVNDSIIVDLTENQATFSHSNGSWSVTIDIHRDLVFGINPGCAVSWSIQAL
ncbi:hypothetical protein RCL1_007462 [Eukaryota sp. TZLM3-RCL]